MYRDLVVGVESKVPLANGTLVTGINFDNAASTPPLVSVLREINNFAPVYASVHRGSGYKSRLSTDLYESARSIVATFVNADPDYHTVIFLKNTTEAINKLSYRLQRRNGKNVVLLTQMEHHSNDLPWRSKYQVDYVLTDEAGRLRLDDLESKLAKYHGRVILVAVTGASNVTGYLNPIHTIAEIAHLHGAQILVDGAQLVPHAPVNMRPSNPQQHLDYLAFSAHKIYAPFGTGVLIGPRETFQKGSPEYSGGGTVKLVTVDKVVWADPPHKEEAGTPNTVGVVALVAAIKTLRLLGLHNLHSYEWGLWNYTVSGLRKLPGLQIYGETDHRTPRIGAIPFNLAGIKPETLANILSAEAGIAVRSGCFCAQPYMRKLLGSTTPSDPGAVRISFGIYNTYAEIDRLFEALTRIVQHRQTYLNTYGM